MATTKEQLKVVEPEEETAMAGKYVYFFGEGKAEGSGEMKNLLGGKGANLAEMTAIGLPVPPGFTITTEACNAYYDNGENLPDGLWDEVLEHMKSLNAQTDKTFGDDSNPLLVAVRSGARASMPGMMDTILNLGLTPAGVKTMGEKMDDPLQMYLADIYTVTASLAGIPGISVPCGKLPGEPPLPVGMQIFARHFDEARMLQVADAFEKAGGFSLS